MSRDKWSLLSLVFAIMAPATSGDSRAVVVQLNGNALLPCDSKVKYGCRGIYWMFKSMTSYEKVPLVPGGEHGTFTRVRQLHCALLIQNVVEEDVGLYFCDAAPITLSVVKGEDPLSVTGLSDNCSLISPEPHKWTIESFLLPSQERYHPSNNSTINTSPLLHCQLTSYGIREMRNFIFEGRAPATTIVPDITTTASNTASLSANDCKQVLFAVIAVFTAALLTLVCVTVLCWRLKAKRSQGDNSRVKEEHYYSTVHFDKETPNRGTEAVEEEEEEEEEGGLYTKVVYSAVRTAPPPGQTHPSALYATVYKP